MQIKYGAAGDSYGFCAGPIIYGTEKIVKVDKLIIGGGISGIFLGLELMKQNDRNFLILEKEDGRGGLCRSFKIGNLYYDIGAHALHKKAIESSKDLCQIIDVNKLYCQKRNAKVFIFNKLIPHPFQLHLFYAPLKIKLRCLVGYLTRGEKSYGNLFDWLRSEFGDQVCKYFLFPYNEKVWRTDLKNISTNWISRVSTGSFKFLRGLFFAGDQNYSSNEYVYYPDKGGFENLFLEKTKQLESNIQVNCEIVEINLDNKCAITKDGKVFQYKCLISTLPIDLLFRKLITKKDDRILGLINQLEKVSGCLVTVLAKKSASKLQRIYVPDSKYLAQRIILNSNSSQYLREQDESVFSLEISYKSADELPPEHQIIDNCKNLLKDLKLIERDDDIKEYRIELIEYMYPTQTLNSINIMIGTKNYLKNYNCYSIGRFGSWNYANVDGILDEVVSLVKTNL